MLDYVCVQSFMITHKQCFMLIVKYKVMCILCIRWLLLVTIMLRCHDNGNVGLCVQSFMITHTQCFMLIVKYKVIYVVIA